MIEVPVRNFLYAVELKRLGIFSHFGNQDFRWLDAINFRLNRLCVLHFLGGKSAARNIEHRKSPLVVDL